MNKRALGNIWEEQVCTFLIDERAVRSLKKIIAADVGRST